MPTNRILYPDIFKSAPEVASEFPQDVEIDYEKGISNCCSALVYMDIGVCADCHEPCGLIPEEE